MQGLLQNDDRLAWWLNAAGAAVSHPAAEKSSALK